MIHSMCGGGLADNEIYSFAKVRFENTALCGDRPYWFINDIVGLKAGDTVTAPFGASETPERAVVLRVDIASEQTPPLPVKRMKRVISVVARA